MQTTWLVQIDTATFAGVAQTLRLTTHNDRRVTVLDGGTWWPVIAQLPVLRYDFFSGDFTGALDVPSGTLVFRDTADIAGAPKNLATLRWAGSRVRIWQGGVGADFASYVLRVDARVSAQPTADAGRLLLDIRPNDKWLDQPLLTTFGGTGGADGLDAMEGTVVPLLLGAPRFAPGVLVDPYNLVWKLSVGPIEGVEAAFNRLARFGESLGDFASYAALIAANIPEGAWATCLAEGLVRHGAPHDGQAAWHVRGNRGGVSGWAQLPGSVIARIAEIKGAAIHLESLTALNGARPWPLSLAFTAQTTAREVITNIAGSVAAAAGVDWLGRLWAQPVGIGAASMVLRSDGRAMPPVASVERTALGAPFWRLATQAAVTHAVVDIADAAYDYTYRGAYKAARQYVPDDVVLMEDGSMWRFVGATPAIGSTPALDNPNWVRELEPQPTYADGTPIDDLKPAEQGANVTGNHTSADTNAVNGRPAPTITQQLDQLDADALAAKAAIAAAEAQAAALGGEVDQLAADLTSAASGLQGQVNGLQQSIQDNATDIASVSSTVGTQGAAITANAQAIDAVEGSLAQTSQSVTALNASVSQQAIAIGGLTDSSAQLRNDLNTTSGRVTTQGQAITSLEGSYGSLSALVSSQSAGITANGLAITNLQGSMANVTTELRAGPGENLIANGNLENGFEGYGPRGGVAFGIEGGWSLGRFAAANIPDDAGTNVVTWIEFPKAECRGVGAKLVFAADVECWSYALPDSGQIHFEFIEYAQDGITELTRTDGPWRAGMLYLDNPAARHVTPFTIKHADTRWVAVRLAGRHTSGRLQRVAFKRAKLERGSIATAYADEATMRMSFTAISNLNLQSAQLRIDLDTTRATVSTHASAITSLDFNVSKLTTTVSAGTRKNLIANGNFENGFEGYRNVNPDIVLGRGWSLGRFAVANIATDKTSWYVYLDSPPAEFRGVGNTFTASVYCNGGTRGDWNQLDCYLEVVGFGADGITQTEIHYAPAHRFGWFDLNDPSSRLVRTSTVKSADTRYLRVRPVVVALDNKLSQASFTNFKLEWGSVATPYEASSSVGLAFDAIQTANQTMAQMNSTLTSQIGGVSATVSGHSATIVTLQNGVAQAFARAAVKLDVNGRIVGWETNNNGTVGDFVIHADHFRIEKPGGGARTEYSDGNWRCYHPNGNLATRNGVWN